MTALRLPALAASVGVAALAAALGVAAPAAARPMDGFCKTNVFNMVCDQPVREDGSWMRCWETYGSAAGGTYLPTTVMCKDTDPATAGATPLFGGVPYHLDADEGM